MRFLNMNVRAPIVITSIPSFGVYRESAPVHFEEESSCYHEGNNLPIIVQGRTWQSQFRRADPKHADMSDGRPESRPQMVDTVFLIGHILPGKVIPTY